MKTNYDKLTRWLMRWKVLDVGAQTRFFVVAETLVSAIVTESTESDGRIEPKISRGRNSDRRGGEEQ